MKKREAYSAIWRVVKLLVGLFLFALGEVFCVQSAVGLAPWDALNSGLIHCFGGTFGRMNIYVGIAVLAVDLLLGQKLGFGTVCNAVLIGTFFDLIQSTGVLPQPGNYFLGILMMLAGLFLISVGTVFYIGAGFGSGPRDSLMVALRCRFQNIPVGAIRGGIEGTVLCVGWLLGGTVGLGTVIAVFGISVILQMTFGLFRFDPAQIEQQSLADTAKAVMQWIRK